MKVIFDVNIWISFAIGKRLSHLEQILLDKKLKVFSSVELFAEFNVVASSTKLSKYIKADRISETIELMNATTKVNIAIKTAFESRDKKDNYLLDLSRQTGADFLVTGDKDLLVLNEYKSTKIISFNEFLRIIKK